MIAVLAATCALAAHGQLPDPVCSPGSVLKSVTQQNIGQTICVPGWAGDHRNVSSSTRARVYRLYGLEGPHPWPEWEVDHLVPLEVGGSNDVDNLFPQHNPQRKDRTEDAAHDAVCSRRMRLRTAQKWLMRDWRVLARRLGVKR